MATWDDVRRIAAELPEAEDGTSYGEPAFRVRKKTFVWMSPHEEGALVVRVDPDEKLLLLESQPELYFVTPHYEGYALLLIRPEHAAEDDLRDRITDSWLLAAPKRLAATLDSG
jgi:hypothetical protein